MKPWCSLVLLAFAPIPSEAQVRVETQHTVLLVGAVTITPSSLPGGGTATGTVTLTGTAGPNGVTVRFTSSNPAIAAVPASTTVQPGMSSATFMIQTYPVAVNPNVVSDPPSAEISAQVGTSSKATKLTVLPPSLTSLTLDPASVAGGKLSTGVVVISGAAPAGGFTIGLTVRRPDAAQGPRQVAVLSSIAAAAPPQVVIPAGATSVSFPITTQAVSASSAVLITAARGTFVSKSATLTVLPPGVGSIGFGLGTYECLVPGQPVTGTIMLTAAAPSQGMTIPLSLVAVSSTPGVYCPSPTACGPTPVVPSTIHFPGGSTSATFPVTVSPCQGCYQVSAGGQTVFLRISPPLIPCCTNGKPTPFRLPSSVKGGTAIQAKLHLEGLVSNCGSKGHYQLESSNTGLAQVPAEVVVPIGDSIGTFTILTSAVASTQTVQIGVRGCYGSCCANFGWRRETLAITP